MVRSEISNLLVYSDIVEKQFRSARKSGLWVAALTLGCSLAECHLLMRAISSIKEVNKNAKYGKTTAREMCEHWGLFELSQLAFDLGWIDVRFMSAGFVSDVTKHLKKTILGKQKEPLEKAIPYLLLGLARVQRNTVHPGKVARDEKPLESRTFRELCKSSCELLDIALTCLRETQNHASLM